MRIWLRYAHKVKGSNKAMIGLKRGLVELHAHEQGWEENAALTIEKLKYIFGKAAVDIQHVGSTAIKSISAKPVIDIAVAVNSFDDVHSLVPALEKEGFYLRQHAAENDMLFVCGDFEADTRTHHIHVVTAGSKEWQDYINFRDYLNNCRDAAKEYERIKHALMQENKNDRVAYTEGKAEFIRKALRDALTWRHLGKLAKVTVDRPLGTYHPRKESIFYTVNYGFVDGVIAGDGGKQDAYILGIDHPVSEFTGVVAAVIHRFDDVEDKWVVIPPGMKITEEEIIDKVQFVEKFYQTKIEMARTKVIHILGASGSGTTTLGRAIRDNLGYVLLDSDDYFWEPTDPPYTVKREAEERQKLMADDMAKCEKCVISGSFYGWGDIFIQDFDLVIFVDTPTPVRIKRLKEREYRHFGDRILPGGDMYDNHLEFIDWAARYDTAGFEQRSRAVHMEWLKQMTCPVITVDGSQPMDAILQKVGKYIFDF